LRSFHSSLVRVLNRPGHATLRAVLIGTFAVAGFQIAARATFAQTTITGFSPPAVQLGTESEITVTGNFPVWPVQIWTDRDDVQITAKEEKGKLLVKTNADTPPGSVWIRFYDQQSASELKRLLIERSRVIPETEPNEKLAQAALIEMPAYVTGVLEKAGDVDVFSVQLAAGETLVASLAAKQLLGSPMDGVMQLTDEAGNVLLQSDDERGIDPQLVYPAKESMKCFLRLLAFPETPTGTIGFAGGGDFVYVLTLTSGRFLDHVLPLAKVSDVDQQYRASGWNLAADESLDVRVFAKQKQAVVFSKQADGWQMVPVLDAGFKLVVESDHAQPQAVELPCAISGRIAEPDEIDRYQFTAQNGKKYSFQVASRSHGFKLDALLKIRDAAGKELASNDDRSGTDFDAGLEFNGPADDQFTLEISDATGFGGVRYGYRIQAVEVQPGFDLQVDADHFAVAATGELEIPVKVVRNGGFDKPIKVAAVDLPAGLTAEPVTSEPTGDSAQKVTLKIVAKDANAFNGEFSIAGDSEIQPAQPASFNLYDGYPLTELWLTVKPAEPAKN